MLARTFRTIDLLTHATPPPPTIQVIEERFLFEQVELDLYRAFDRAVMISMKKRT